MTPATDLHANRHGESSSTKTPEEQKAPTQRLIDIDLKEALFVKSDQQYIENECKVAIADLLDNNVFAPKKGPKSLYKLRLRLSDEGLLFHIFTTKDEEFDKISLSLKPFRKIIKDYLLVCGNYYDAVENATPAYIETMDRARRALHNEAATLLQKNLSATVHVDMATARRLFTLLCALNTKRQSKAW